MFLVSLNSKLSIQLHSTYGHLQHVIYENITQISSNNIIHTIFNKSYLYDPTINISLKYLTVKVQYNVSCILTGLWVVLIQKSADGSEICFFHRFWHVQKKIYIYKAKPSFSGFKLSGMFTVKSIWCIQMFGCYGSHWRQEKKRGIDCSLSAELQ